MPIYFYDSCHSHVSCAAEGIHTSHTMCLLCNFILKITVQETLALNVRIFSCIVKFLSQKMSYIQAFAHSFPRTVQFVVNTVYSLLNAKDNSI